MPGNTASCSKHANYTATSGSVSHQTTIKTVSFREKTSPQQDHSCLCLITELRTQHCSWNLPFSRHSCHLGHSVNNKLEAWPIFSQNLEEDFHWLRSSLQQGCNNLVSYCWGSTENCGLLFYLKRPCEKGCRVIKFGARCRVSVECQYCRPC